MQTYFDEGGRVHVHSPIRTARWGGPAGASAARADAAPTRSTAGRWGWSKGRAFSTRAESGWLARAGLVGGRDDRGSRKRLLARELGLCYAVIALVTDLDAGVER